MTKEELLADFREVVHSTFAAIRQDFGFEICREDVHPPNMWIGLKNAAGVELTIDFEWGGSVAIIAEKRRRFGRSERHDVVPLLEARTGMSFPQDRGDGNYEHDRVQAALASLATALEAHAQDVLRGDFSGFHRIPRRAP
jgi:hypothetical protein